jgi:hypothetical protein
MKKDQDDDFPRDNLSPLPSSRENHMRSSSRETPEELADRMKYDPQPLEVDQDGRVR